MRRSWRYVALVLVLVPTIALARGGGSGGGGGSRSYSGGGSRSYSAPSRPSAPSRNYSAPSRPSAPSRNYSAPSNNSGSSRGYTGGGSGSTGRSYGGGSGSWFTGGSGKAAVGGAVGGAVVGHAAGADAAAGKAAHESSSASKYQAANPTKWANPDVSKRKIESIPRDSIRTRNERSRVVFQSYNNQPVPSWAGYTYQDPFSNPWFWMYLMDSNNQSQRDEWLYHHRDEIDPARYQQLQQQDATLDARLKALEANGKVKDPSYQDPNVKDLQYGDAAVKAVTGEEDSDGMPSWLKIVFVVVGVVAVCAVAAAWVMS